ncbi:uncharacterized protein L203_101214 [Cryptococcus depauperatus CBS 7841]|uniref:Amino acid transporter transmembrane domain-containing protein n=1 Tax=Cryptococcus depauperatus CBS 7841 TaxID=1295531 RepID=A0AAJ8LZZ2_9TREE
MNDSSFCPERLDEETPENCSFSGDTLFREDLERHDMTERLNERDVVGNHKTRLTNEWEGEQRSKPDRRTSNEAMLSHVDSFSSKSEPQDVEDIIKKLESHAGPGPALPQLLSPYHLLAKPGSSTANHYASTDDKTSLLKTDALGQDHEYTSSTIDNSGEVIPVFSVEEFEEHQPLLTNTQQQFYDSTEPCHDKQSFRRRLELGQSTDGQTLFNATAVLVGIGLLSMPVAFSYAGWILGTVLLIGFGWLACYTAKLLAKLIRADDTLLGYTDIGRKAFGSWAESCITFLFCTELFALGVALILLFGDTLHVLFSNVSSNTWKLIGFFIIVPTTLLPLHLLSLPSLLSFVSSLLLVIVLVIDGILPEATPSNPSPHGSILHPEPTSWLPEWHHANWLGEVGLILAGFGGHAVMPSLARDMKQPENGVYDDGLEVSDEITKDMMQEKYCFPKVLNIIALWMIIINPLTKFGLSSRPLNLSLEYILGISPSLVSESLNFPVDTGVPVESFMRNRQLSFSSNFSQQQSYHSSPLSQSRNHRCSLPSPTQFSDTSNAATQSQIESFERKERFKWNSDTLAGF